MFGWGITFSCVFLVPDDVLSTELQGEVCNETEASIFRYDLIEDWEKGNWNNVMEAVGLQKMEQERNLMNEESFTKVWGTRFSRAMRGIGRTFTSNEKSLVDDEIEDTSSEKGDVDDPDHEKCVPKFVVVKTKTLVIYWSVLYWGSFFGTWLIFPLLISYVDMADFHFSERLSGAIKENILIYRFFFTFTIPFHSSPPSLPFLSLFSLFFLMIVFPFFFLTIFFSFQLVHLVSLQQLPRLC